jgi:hypothetical protein
MKIKLAGAMRNIVNYGRNSMVKLTSADENSDIKNRKKNTIKREEKVEIIFVFRVLIVLKKVGYVMCEFFQNRRSNASQNPDYCCR